MGQAPGSGKVPAKRSLWAPGVCEAGVRLLPQGWGRAALKEPAFEKRGQAQGRLEVTGSAASLVEPWATGAGTHLKDGKGQCGWDLGGSSLWLPMEESWETRFHPGERPAPTAPCTQQRLGWKGETAGGPAFGEQMKWGGRPPLHLHPHGWGPPGSRLAASLVRRCFL